MHQNPYEYSRLKLSSYRSQGEVTMQLQEIGQVKLGEYSEQD